MRRDVARRLDSADAAAANAGVLGLLATLALPRTTVDPQSRVLDQNG